MYFAIRFEIERIQERGNGTVTCLIRNGHIVASDLMFDIHCSFSATSRHSLTAPLSAGYRGDGLHNLFVSRKLHILWFFLLK